MKLPVMSLMLLVMLLANTCSHGQRISQTELARYPALIIGKWQSLQDPKSFLVITKAKYEEVYEQEHVAALTYEITNSCPDSSVPNPRRKEKDILVTHEASGESSYCYGIELLTSKRLTLTYLGRGNSLIFKRIH